MPNVGSSCVRNTKNNATRRRVPKNGGFLAVSILNRLIDLVAHSKPRHRRERKLQSTLPLSTSITGSTQVLGTRTPCYAALIRSLAEIGKNTMGNRQIKQLGDALDLQLAHDR